MFWCNLRDSRFLTVKFPSFKETRRRQQAEAAERRLHERESHGIKDPEALKRKQRRQEELEKQSATASSSDTGLRVRPFNSQSIFEFI